MRHDRALRLLPAAVAVIAALTACGEGADAQPQPQAPGESTEVQVAIRDFALRAVDAACSGAKPYLDIHAGAAYTVLGAAGDDRAVGTLPQGRAIKAQDIDFGVAKKEPTMCLFTLSVPARLDEGDYAMVLGDDRRAPFTVGPHQDGPVTLTYPEIGSPS